MIIYLNDIIEFHNKQYGSPKFTKVRQLFTRPPYNPNTDFYKPIRDAIVGNIKQENELNKLVDFIERFKHSSKENRYTKLVPGCVKFFKRKQMKWFKPPSGSWIYKELCVKVNPDLGLFINDVPYIIKLHFKECALRPSDIQTMLRLMDRALASGIYTGYRCAILDVERGRLHEAKPIDPLLDVLLEAEADSFIRLWSQLDKKAA